MTALRFFATARPSLVGAPVIGMDPREQAALDELRRRRIAAREAAERAPQAASSGSPEACPSHASASEAGAGFGEA